MSSTIKKSIFKRFLIHATCCFVTVISINCEGDHKELKIIKIEKEPRSLLCTDFSNLKSNNHENFLFSKIFIVPPKHYNKDSLTGRFYLDNENYIQVQESKNISFYSRKYFFTQKALDSMGANIISHCPITVNGYEGYMITGQLTDNDSRKKTEIVFGNSNFTNLIFATFNTPKNEKEINTALATVYYDSTFHVNAEVNTPFKVHLEKTKFKLNSSLSNIYVYTIDGKGEPFNKDFLAPQFQIFKTPYIGDTVAIKLHFGKILNGIEQNGVIGTKLRKLKSFSHKSRWNYIVSKDVSYQGKKGVLYLFVTSSLKGNLALLGTSYTDGSKYVSLYEKIALSLDTN